MIDCVSTKELMYKRHFMNLSIEVLKGLLEQYRWERENDLSWNGIQIDILEEVINYKSNEKGAYETVERF